MTPEQRLEQLGLKLPEVPVPVANYVPWRFAGNLLYLSGQGPKRADGTYKVGRLGRDMSVEEAYQEARLTGLNLLAAAKAATGDLSRIEAVVNSDEGVAVGRDTVMLPRSRRRAGHG